MSHSHESGVSSARIQWRDSGEVGGSDWDLQAEPRRSAGTWWEDRGPPKL